MLIPKKEFLTVRQDYYDLLNQYAKTETFKIKKKEYTVNKVLYVHWKREDNTASQIPSPYLSVVNDLTAYADGRDIYDFEDEKFHPCYSDMKDQVWYDITKYRLCGGFDHVLNHQYLLEQYPNIVDSFLVLDIEDV